MKKWVCLVIIVFLSSFTITNAQWITISLNFTDIAFGSIDAGTENNPAENNYQISISSGNCTGQLQFINITPTLTYDTHTIPNENIKLNYTMNLNNMTVVSEEFYNTSILNGNMGLYVLDENESWVFYTKHVGGTVYRDRSIWRTKYFMSNNSFSPEVEILTKDTGSKYTPSCDKFNNAYWLFSDSHSGSYDTDLVYKNSTDGETWSSEYQLLSNFYGHPNPFVFAVNNSFAYIFFRNITSDADKRLGYVTWESGGFNLEWNEIWSFGSVGFGDIHALNNGTDTIVYVSSTGNIFGFIYNGTAWENHTVLADNDTWSDPNAFYDSVMNEAFFFTWLNQTIKKIDSYVNDGISEPLQYLATLQDDGNRTQDVEARMITSGKALLAYDKEFPTGTYNPYVKELEYSVGVGYPSLLTLNVTRVVNVSDGDVVYPEYYLTVPPQTYSGDYETNATILGVCV